MVYQGRAHLRSLKGKGVSMFIRRIFFGVLAGAVFGVGTASAQTLRLLEQRESLYNNIYVTEKLPFVGLSFGHNNKFYAESIFNTTDDRDLPVPYTRVMTVGVMYAKEMRSMVEI